MKGLPPFTPATALLILLVLLLRPPGPRASCSTGTANECRKAPLAPGADLAGEGYDVVKLHRTGAFAVDMKAWRHQDGTCTLCRNSQMEGSVQRLPRAVTDWRVRPECQRHLSAKLFESASELEDSVSSGVDSSWSAGLGINVKPENSAKLTVLGTRSKLASFAHKRSATDRYSFTSHTFQCQLYEYRLVHRPRLAPQFIQMARNLPRTLEPSTRFFYQRFLRTFGTHYISGVRLGGRIQDVTALRTCQVASEGQTVEEVKDCLEIEAEAQMGSKVQMNAKYQACQEARSKLAGQKSFNQEYSDRQVEVTGGTIGTGTTDLLFSSGEASDFGTWLSGLASAPGVIYHRLEPLHLLIPGTKSNPRRHNLRQALVAYIMGHAEGATGRNCSGLCHRGSTPDPRQPCVCRCHQTQEVDGLCCPRGKGWGLLEVTVNRGQDLWGDYVGATDAYVRVRYRRATGPELVATTSVVANNNNPVWDATLHLGEIQLGPEGEDSLAGLTVECWDQDHGYDDDLLGSCKASPLTAGLKPRICYFTYGSLSFEVSLTCGPHLGGSRCRQYVAEPPPRDRGGSAQAPATQPLRGLGLAPT